MHLSLLAIGLGLFAPLLALAAPTDTPQVLTPYGHRPAADVVEVPEGASINHIGDEIHVIDPKGKVLHKTTATGNFTKTTPAPNAGLQNGWIAYASWMNTGASPINYFDTTWTVPNLPFRPNDGQVLFLFNSIEPNTYDAILQPVLQYGVSAAGGGAYWAVANWYGYNNKYYHTAPIRVNPGRVLQGIMLLTGTGSQGFGYNYWSYFNGIGGKMIVYGSKQLRWATETLEVYNLKSTSDFPPWWTVFSNIHLRTTAGYPSTWWGTVSSAIDGVHTYVLRQGSNGASVEIVY
ncbi:hypothetical protein DL93DRAFT_2075591 [Clavulina sp. PMI_390]|nr:hypothetical protein DL93DRAFT_2075591 [Clavulina sp. PMI_390]